MLCQKIILSQRPNSKENRFLKMELSPILNINNLTAGKNSLPNNSKSKNYNLNNVINSILFFNKLKKKKNLFVDRISIGLFNSKGINEFKRHWSVKDNQGIFSSSSLSIINSVSGLKNISKTVIDCSLNKKELSKIYWISNDKTYNIIIDNDISIGVVKMSGNLYFPKMNQTVFNCLIFILK